MLYVTDHALLRFLERVRGFKFERERDQIRKICAAISGTGTVILHGCRFEVVSGRVVTITPANNCPSRTKQAEVRERMAI